MMNVIAFYALFNTGKVEGAGRKGVYSPKTEGMHPWKAVFLKYEVFLEGIYFVNVSLPQQNLVEELGGSCEQQSNDYGNSLFLKFIILRYRKEIYMCV